MSRYDGTDEPLTIAEVLVAMAMRISWTSQEERDEIVAAIRAHDEFVTAANDDEDQADSAELAELRAELERTTAELQELRNAGSPDPA